MNWATPYEGAVRCTSGPEPGARALLAWLAESVEGWSGGIFNCRSVRGASTKSIHGEGRAVDWMMLRGPDGKGTPEGWEVVRRLGAHGARLGIQCVIYDRRIFSASSPEGRPYNGVAPHHDHAHIELTREAAARMTLATFRAVLGETEEDDDMATIIRVRNTPHHYVDTGGAISHLAEAADIESWRAAGAKTVTVSQPSFDRMVERTPRQDVVNTKLDQIADAIRAS